VSAPSRERTPLTIQTRSDRLTEPPTWRRMGPGVRKMPEPMTEADEEEEKISKAKCADELRHEFCWRVYGAPGRNAS